MEQELLLNNCEKSLDKYAHLKTKEKRREYNHKFYENNKDKDIKRACEICAGSYTIFNKSHHKKSKKHIKGMLLKEQEAKVKQELENEKLRVENLNTEINI